MATSADGHTAEEASEIAGTTMHDSESQLDDDCVSENSFGSYDGDDDGDIELDPLLHPVYPEQYPQSTSIPANRDQQLPRVVPQYRAARSTEPALNARYSGPSMCVVCKVLPAYRKGQVSYPTCGLTCASKMPNVPIPRRNRFLPGATAPSSRNEMCEVCHVRPRARTAGKIYRTCGFTCDAALTKGRSSNEGNSSVPTLDPMLIALLRQLSMSDHSYGTHNSPQQDYRRRPRQVRQPNCVVCRVQPCYDDRYVTCGTKCAETLCKRGNSNPNICDYCHRRPKIPGHNQCGKICRDNARTACLLCRYRPKFGRYPLCGRTCKKIATKWTPLILEAPPGHTIHNEVQERFKRAWKAGGACPSIKNIYKIIENESFLLPYDRYKKQFGNEVFRYHGTSRQCTLGSNGNTQLCSSTGCALCSILRTSFDVGHARNGRFGAGIYTSSAASKSYGYMGGSGAMILTKVVLGTVHATGGWMWNARSSGHSVVYDDNGASNETVVYTNDAIRPVFLIIF